MTIRKRSDKLKKPEYNYIKTIENKLTDKTNIKFLY